MPYQSVQQSRFIHAKAAQGVPWAVKFVHDAHGTHVLNKGVKKAAIRKHLKKRRHHAHR